MDWGKVASTIGKVAPIVGTVVGGPVGAVGGGVISAICSLFGTDPNDPAAPELLEAAIQADPESALKLKQFQLENVTELQRLAIESDRMFLLDRQDARARQVAVEKATGKKDVHLYVLAYGVVLGFFLLCGILMKYKLPDGANEVVFMLFGALAAGFGSVLQYFFGSSKGSSEKTAMLAVKQGG